jgi:putative DNA primase/helicase
MELTTDNNPLHNSYSKYKKNNVVSLNPQFEDLQQPETHLNHVQEITETKETPHAEILIQLIEQFEPLDFEAMANPHNAENFKLSNKHHTVLSIENVLKMAENNRWGLCKNHDFIYLFNGTYWDELNKEIFQKFLGKAAEKMGVPIFSARYHKFRKELYEQFLGTAYLEHKPPLANKVLINLQNGTFEVSPKGTQLRPFDRSDFLTYQLAFEYNPEAKAPIFEAYLNKVLPDIKRQNILAEYLGYVFMKHGYKGLKLEKALLLYGTGQNGKSVFFDVVNSLFGFENTSTYSLENLSNQRGEYRAKIANKLVNYASEINGKLESAIFKQLVSGEPIEARALYGQPYTIKQYAKLIFNCNELPKDVEHTNAYFRRFLIVPFDVTISEKEKDIELADKIIEKELSGVFNWVLDGLNRLLEQKRFTDCEAVKQALEQYKSQSDTVKLFVDENEYQISAADYILIKELYREYRVFCIEDGFKPVNKSNFIKRLSGFGVLVNRLNVGNVAYLSNGKRPF